MSESTVLSEKTLHELVKLLKTLAQESIHVRIIMVLAKKGCLSLRGVAREVGMAPKNVRKYLDRLEALGIVTCMRPSKKMFLYKLNDQYAWLQELVKQIDFEGTKTGGGGEEQEQESGENVQQSSTQT